eukprot:GILJ01007684.1.p1 GENE.GILJ01007684.1~~GILJ01007684.1.p1  ORF type:complete len:450 (+),score=67.36 GILJ01007684.1:89-1351(+)
MATRLLNVVVPKTKCSALDRVIKLGELRNVIRSEGYSSEVFQYTIRTEAFQLQYVLDLLSHFGVGSRFGLIELIAVEATKRGSDQQMTSSIPEVERLSLEEIWVNVCQQSRLTADFVVFLVMAALIAAVGLATDSVVTVVASMLVSPLMGPVFGVTFGSVIRDWKMVKQGLKAELVGFLLCFFVGIVVGCICLPFTEDLAWPTHEMLSRTRVSGLIQGMAVAIPSGAGVAVAVSVGHVNSIVGVAISVSLLPPIVNSGLLLPFAFFAGSDTVFIRKYILQAAVSMGLSLVNIVCIYISGYITFLAKSTFPNAKRLPLAILKQHRDAMWRLEESVLEEGRLSEIFQSTPNVPFGVKMAMARQNKHKLSTETISEPIRQVENVDLPVDSDVDVHSCNGKPATSVTIQTSPLISRKKSGKFQP